MLLLLDEANPVHKFLSGRLRLAATSENVQRVISLALQQLIMPAVMPQLLVQLGHPSGQFDPLIAQFDARCQLVLQHPNFIDSLNLPSRDCSFEMSIKQMSRLPLMTDPHALLSCIVAVVDSAQSDLKTLIGQWAPVLTGDHMFCLFLYFILKASPAPHHLLSEVVTLLNTPLDLEGSRGYIAATYSAAVAYIVSFSTSLQQKTQVEFISTTSTLRHAPSKRFTKRLMTVQAAAVGAGGAAAVGAGGAAAALDVQGRPLAGEGVEMDPSSSDDDNDDVQDVAARDA